MDFSLRASYFVFSAVIADRISERVPALESTIHCHLLGSLDSSFLNKSTASQNSSSSRLDLINKNSSSDGQTGEEEEFIGTDCEVLFGMPLEPLEIGGESGMAIVSPLIASQRFLSNAEIRICRAEMF